MFAVVPPNFIRITFAIISNKDKDAVFTIDSIADDSSWILDDFA